MMTPTMEPTILAPELQGRISLLYHYCRVKFPGIRVSFDAFRNHLERTYRLAIRQEPCTPEAYLDGLYVLDWYLCCACLTGDNAAWETLFATRTGRSDRLLVDALRDRARRFYPRDFERQENAVSEFWTHLLIAEAPSIPILARYDGHRPLTPWLIRVFHNWVISALRPRNAPAPLPEEDIAPPLPPTTSVDGRWNEVFRLAARDWLDNLTDADLVLLGLRWRYRLSQRDVAKLLGVHEGTITRRIDALRERCLDHVGNQMVAEGWTGDGLSELALTEMESLLTDEPRLSADQLARLLKAQGKSLPQSN